MNQTPQKKQNKLGCSFRDPSGFIFKDNGILYRQINKSYRENYRLLMNSGLCKKLAEEKLLIPHQEKDGYPISDTNGYKIIEPNEVPFVSYPYEWCFSQLKDAALLTLKIQKIAMAHNMSLKDASAYNIQFYEGKAIFIDTLSFEILKSDKPWVAYKQFCQHFLAPLALMSYRDMRMGQMLRIFIDGLPLDLTSKLLPTKSKLNFSLLTHIHLHAKSQAYYADKTINASQKKMSAHGLLALIDSLESTVKKIKSPHNETEWGDYYTFTNYSETALNSKKNIIKNFLKQAEPQKVWDLGANNGLFSRLASDQCIETVAFDIDFMAIEKNYHTILKNKEKNILSLFSDLINPSPNLGWAEEERDSLSKRGPVDMVMALALIHHLAISNNLPFDNVAKFLSRLGKWLIIEFVPKEDSKVKKLLSHREDIFDHYTENDFEQSFGKYLFIKDKQAIEDSKRILYLMANK